MSSRFHLVPGGQRGISVQWLVHASQPQRSVPSEAVLLVRAGTAGVQFPVTPASTVLTLLPLPTGCALDPRRLLLPQASFQGYLHDPGWGWLAAGFYFAWVDNLMSFLKFKFRTTRGARFWDLLQEVLHAARTRIPRQSRKRELRRALDILGRSKKKFFSSPPSAGNAHNCTKERGQLKPHSQRTAGRKFSPGSLAYQSRACSTFPVLYHIAIHGRD